MSLSVKRSPSVESTGSIVLSNTDARTGSTVGGSSESQYELYDCSAVLIECPTHKKYALQRISGKKGLWLPKAVVTPQTGFNIAITSKLKQVLAAPGARTAKGHINFSPPEIFHYLRLQVPEVKKFVTRCVYKTRLIPEGGVCCTATKDVVWVSSADLESSRNMWGPEPGIFIRSLNQGQIPEPLQEMTTANNLKPGTQGDAVFLDRCKFKEKDVQRLYCEYIQHCWPAQLMTKESLASYFMATKWIANPQHVDGFFRAFSLCQRNYLNFHEFLRGIVAADRQTDHGSLPGQIRSEYIFRLYDADGDMLLSPAEFRHLVKDAFPNDKHKDANAIEKHAAHVASALGLPSDTRWDEKLLKEAIGGLHLRGTSKLFRGKHNLCSSRANTMPTTFAYRSIDSSFEGVTTLTVGRTRSSEPKCPECKSKHYMVATHSVRLKQDGQITDPLPITIRDNEKMSPELRTQSNEVFNKQSAPNIAMTMIKSKQLGAGGGPQLMDVIFKICGQAERIMKSEGKMVRITAPVLVTGALLGNSQTLLGLEKIFWPKGPCVEAPTFLFLGNNITTGIGSLETIMYLLALKVQCPNRVILLRGRQETKGQVDKLVKEISAKLGPDGAARVGGALNGTMEAMPLTAIIDHSIFCSSSGVPGSLSSPEELIHGQNQNVSSDILNAMPQQQEGIYGSFLNKSGFSHIITGSEPSDTGIRYRLNGRAISIFSCGNYENKKNTPGILLVDNSKIRPIRVNF